MMGFGLFGFGMLFMILFGVLIVGGGIWLVVALARGSQGQPASRTLMPGAPAVQSRIDILKARYAKVEITKKQFEDMKRGLEA